MSVKSIVVKVVIGVVIVALLSSLIYFLSVPEKEEKVEVLTVLNRDETKIQKIEVIKGDSFALNFTPSGWEMEGMEGIGVNLAYASSLAKSMSNITSPMLAEENALRLFPYGLDEESDPVLVKVSYTDGEDIIKIGNKSGGFYYVCIEGNSDVYIVAENDLSMVFMDKMNYLDTNILSIDAESIEYVAYSSIELIKENGDWIEKKPYSFLANANEVTLKILEPVSNIKAVEIVKKDNLKLKKETDVVIKTADCEYRLEVYKDKESYYVVNPDSSYANRMSSSELAFLNVKGFDLLSRYVAPVAITEVTNIEFVAPNKTVVLSIDAPSSQAPIFYKDGEEAKEESFRNFYAKLMGLTFNGEGTAYKAGEYSIRFTKENGEKTDIRFIPANESEYAISINGKTEFLILKKSVTDVFDALRDIELM